jgi:hypothetical protein
MGLPEFGRKYVLWRLSPCITTESSADCDDGDSDGDDGGDGDGGVDNMCTHTYVRTTVEMQSLTVLLSARQSHQYCV